MRRSLMLTGLAALCVCLGSPSEARAQIGGIGVGADPFSFYYGYYLPHAQYMAAQPTALDSINRVTANRQAAASTDRSTLYDPISPYGEDDLDPLRPYSSSRGGQNRAVRARGFNMSDQTHAKGTGPSGYYNRTAQYFPTLRVGRGPNQNMAMSRGPRRGGGGGMPTMPQSPMGGGMPSR